MAQERLRGYCLFAETYPLLIKKVRQEALEKLFEANSLEEPAPKITEAHNVINRYVKAVERGDMNIHELFIFRDSGIRERCWRPPEYILRSSSPCGPMYTRGSLAPLNIVIEKVLDLGSYVKLLERARRNA